MKYTVTCPDCGAKLVWALQSEPTRAICPKCFKAGPKKKKGLMLVAVNPKRG